MKKLCLGEVERAVSLDGVLRSHYEKGLGQLVGLAVEGYLPLLHCLEQGGLYLRRGTVYLVREQEVAHYCAVAVNELARFAAEHGEARDIRGHDVGGELYAVELAAYRPRKRGYHLRLADARDVLEEHVTLAEQSGDESDDGVVLADDDLAYGIGERLYLTVHSFPHN